MRKIRLSERRFALYCAVILISLSGFAAFRDNSYLSALLHPVAHAPTTPEQTTPTRTQTSTHTQEQATTTTNSPSTTATTTRYHYTAATGESYTEFARAAIASYADELHLNLADDQRLNAEVALTNAAGAPLLEIGQQVSISRDDITTTLRSHGVAATAPTVTRATGVASTAASNDTSTDSVTAQAGDNYTTLVRSAISRYTQQQHITLDAVQAVAAESTIVAAAHFPGVDVGTPVSLAHDTLARAISSAQAISTAERAAWQQYADLIAR